MEEQLINQTEEIQEGNDRLAGALSSLSGAISNQTVILQTMLDNDIKTANDERLRSEQEGVSGDNAKSSTTSSGGFNFRDLIGGNKKKIFQVGLIAAAAPFILQFLKGILTSLAEESNIAGFFAEGALGEGAFAGILTGSTIGFLVGGPIGALVGGFIGLLVSSAVEFIQKKINESDFFSQDMKDSINEALDNFGAVMVGIGTAAVIFIKRITKMISGMRARLLGQKPTPTPAPSTPKTGPLDASERSRLGKVTDSQLKDAGIKRTTTKDGKVQYRNISDGTFATNREVLERSDKNLIQRAMRKFPGFAKFGGPALAAGINLAQVAALMLNDELSGDEKRDQITELLGGVVGASLLGILGAMAGTALLPGFGSLAGGVAGSVAGLVGGEFLAKEYVVPFLFGDNIDPASAETVAIMGQSLAEESSKNPGESRRSRRQSRQKPTDSYVEPALESASFTVADTGQKVIPLDLNFSELDFMGGSAGGNTFNNVQPISNNVKQGDTVVGGSQTTVIINKSASESLSNNIPIPST